MIDIHVGGMRGARHGFVAVALMIALLPMGARADQSATARGNRIAYEAAIKCFIADGILTGDKRKEGDKTAEATFEAKARQSFEVAVTLGGKLGYSGTRVNEDFGLAQAREMARLMNDSGYFKRTAATCKALDLM